MGLRVMVHVNKGTCSSLGNANILYDSMKRASGCRTLVGEPIQPHQTFLHHTSSIIHCNMTCYELVFRATEAGYVNHKRALRAPEGAVLQFTAKYSDSH